MRAAGRRLGASNSHAHGGDIAALPPLPPLSAPILAWAGSAEVKEAESVFKYTRAGRASHSVNRDLHMHDHFAYKALRNKECMQSVLIMQCFRVQSVLII